MFSSGDLGRDPSIVFESEAIGEKSRAFPPHCESGRTPTPEASKFLRAPCLGSAIRAETTHRAAPQRSHEYSFWISIGLHLHPTGADDPDAARPPEPKRRSVGAGPHGHRSAGAPRHLC